MPFLSRSSSPSQGRCSPTSCKIFSTCLAASAGVVERPSRAAGQGGQQQGAHGGWQRQMARPARPPGGPGKIRAGGPVRGPVDPRNGGPGRQSFRRRRGSSPAAARQSGCRARRMIKLLAKQMSRPRSASASPLSKALAAGLIVHQGEGKEIAHAAHIIHQRMIGKGVLPQLMDMAPSRRACAR